MLALLTGFPRCSRHLRSFAFSLAVATGLTAGDNRSSYTLADLSLEELINIEIVSVSKKQTSLFRSPAAIAVVTADDIRRLGATSYPEAMRGVPGLHVGRIDQNAWAVGSRGFASQFSDKLLVLHDGRSIFTPGFNGVFWDAHDAVVEDVERIEVIRGPGATLWGANAVNGVINIITKRAADTQGGLISTAGGPGEGRELAVRYGGQAGENVFYRVYAKAFDRDPMVDAAGEDLSQDWKSLRAGARVDWQPTSADVLTFHVDSHQSRVREMYADTLFTPPYVSLRPIVSDSASTSLLARWTHTFADDSEFSVQSYYDTGWYDGHGTLELRDTFDLEVQHRFTWGERHEIVWGAGYRTSGDDMRPAPHIIWTPQRKTIELASAFVQDEIALIPEKLNLVVGSKFEHHEATGLETQPGVRMLWTPAARHTLWACVARAVRTPSRLNLDALSTMGVRELGPGMPLMRSELRPSPELESEVLQAYELGYRTELSSQFTVDVAAFHNDYSKFMSFLPLPPEFSMVPVPHMVAPGTFANSGRARVIGGEIDVQVMARAWWRVGANWSVHEVRPNAATGLPSTNSRQAGLRSYLDLPHRIELTTALTWVNAQPPPLAGMPGVPAYTRLDLGVIWRPLDSVELGIWGRNLLDSHHQESIGFTTAQPAYVPRSFLGRVTWRF